MRTLKQLQSKSARIANHPSTFPLKTANKKKAISTTTQDYTIRAVNENLKILVPSEQIVRAQLERATASGADLKSIVDQKQKQLEQKLTKLDRDMKKLADRMSKPGYETSVPEEIKEKNRYYYYCYYRSKTHKLQRLNETRSDA